MIHTAFLFLWIAADKIDQLHAWMNRTFNGASYRVYHGFQGDALQSQGPRSTALPRPSAQSPAAGQTPSIAIATNQTHQP